MLAHLGPLNRQFTYQKGTKMVVELAFDFLNTIGIGIIIESGNRSMIEKIDIEYPSKPQYVLGAWNLDIILRDA